VQEVTARFATLRDGSRTLAAASGAQRAERLRGMLAAVLNNKQRFYDAAHTEMKACDLDVAAQLVMVKSEVDFVAKRVGGWMKRRRVRNSAATLGKKCTSCTSRRA
jgi:aldehyde dehydrogenase (NAD+)